MLAIVGMIAFIALVFYGELVAAGLLTTLVKLPDAAQPLRRRAFPVLCSGVGVQAAGDLAHEAGSLPQAAARAQQAGCCSVLNPLHPDDAAPAGQCFGHR